MKAFEKEHVTSEERRLDGETESRGEERRRDAGEQGIGEFNAGLKEITRAAQNVRHQARDQLNRGEHAGQTTF